MFTPVTREGEGEGGSRSKAPNFSAAPGWERPARSCKQVEAQGEPAEAGQGTAHTPPAGARGGEDRAVHFRHRQRRSRTRRGREHRARVRNPQARRAGSVPAIPAPRPAGASGRGEGPAGGPDWVPSSSSPARLGGSGAAALTWFVRGGRDGHGSGARGGTGSPGKDRLFGRRAGESGRQAAPSPVSAAAPWTPTRSFSAAAGPPSHYPPPSSAAAASSASSSAETPRPLHTLSHHAAGEPLPRIRHFRAQVARSGPGASGCWGRGRTLWGN